MPITLRSVRSNVDIGGISRAFANAQAGINAGLGNLQNTATGVGVKKDEDALKSFRDSIAGASVNPGSIEQFVDHIVPELQRRGRFRTEYTGTTVRDHIRQQT
jgi:hypothetical protein